MNSENEKDTSRATDDQQMSLFGETRGEETCFTGAGHLTILVSLRRDIGARKPLLVLTGEDGCGKSVFGRKIVAEASGGCIPVFLDQGASSFEEMLDRIYERLDIEQEVDAKASAEDRVEEIASWVAGRNARLLVVCDGAERLYLATLERLKKMVDRLNRVVVSMQLLLIGRDALLENLRHLSIGEFLEIEEKRYVLPPLSQAETRSYLELCKQKMGEAEREIFTPEVIERIYRDTHGNFRKIHQLGEQLSNRTSANASFWVLLENVEGASPPADRLSLENLKRMSRRLDPRWLFERRQRLLPAAGGVLVLLCMGLIVWLGGSGPVSGENGSALPVTVVNEPPGPDAPAVPDTAGVSDEETESDKTKELGSDVLSQAKDTHESGGKPEKPMSGPPAAGTVAPDTVIVGSSFVEAVEGAGGDAVEKVMEGETIVASPAREQIQQAREILVEAERASEIADREVGQELDDSSHPLAGGQNAEVQPDVKSGVIVVRKARIIESEIPVYSRAKSKAPLLKAERRKQIAAPLDDAPQQKRESSMALGETSGESGPVRGSVPVLVREKEKEMKNVSNGTKKTTGDDQQYQSADFSRPSSQVAGSKVEGRTMIAAEPKKVPTLAHVIIPQRGSSMDGIAYPELVSAGRTWLTGEKNDKFTLQLMALHSESARQNMQDLLAKVAAKSDVANIYVLEKKRNQAIFVFWGEFATLAEAKAAKEKMSGDLLQYTPYVLPVREAVAKVR